MLSFNLTLGVDAVSRMTIIIGDPVAVAEHIQRGREDVKNYRLSTNDAYYFNWTMHIPSALLSPFVPTHESMSALELGQGSTASKSRLRTASFVFWHRRRQRQTRGPTIDRLTRPLF